MDIFDYISIILAFSAITLHSTGLYLLWKTRFVPGVNAVFIVNFSMWCLLWALNNVLRYPLSENVVGSEIRAFWLIILEGSRITFYSAVLLITWDRFCQLYLHLKYQDSLIFKHKILLCLVVFCFYVVWLITAMILYGIKNQDLQQLLQIPRLYISTTLHAIIVLSFGFVYTYILRKSLAFTSRNTARTKLWRRLTIPAVIMGSFLLLEVLPELFINLGDSIYGSWTILLFRLDSNLNALFYIFTQPMVRQRLQRNFQILILRSNIVRRKPSQVTRQCSNAVQPTINTEILNFKSYSLKIRFSQWTKKSLELCRVNCISILKELPWLIVLVKILIVSRVPCIARNFKFIFS